MTGYEFNKTGDPKWEQWKEFADSERATMRQLVAERKASGHGKTDIDTDDHHDDAADNKDADDEIGNFISFASSIVITRPGCGCC
jgi:hypothetical protein